MALLPIVFILFYKIVLGDQVTGNTVESDHFQVLFTTMILTMGVCMASGMISPMVVLNSIAEEREKYTLRTLMLANVSGGQMLVSKAIVALVVTLVAEVAIFFIVGVDVAQLAPFIAIVLI